MLKKFRSIGVSYGLAPLTIALLELGQQPFPAMVLASLALTATSFEISPFLHPLARSFLIH